MEDEIAAIEQLLAMPVKRDKKLTELLGLTDHIARESGRGDGCGLFHATIMRLSLCGESAAGREFGFRS